MQCRLIPDFVLHSKNMLTTAIIALGEGPGDVGLLLLAGATLFVDLGLFRR